MYEDVKINLNPNDMPKEWYNLAADLPTPMLPPLGPDGKPVSADQMTAIFPPSIVEQEMCTKSWVTIPEEIRQHLMRWRPTPLRRAYWLEQYLKTPAKIYYKDESASPAGSHKAIPPSHRPGIINKREQRPSLQKQELVNGAVHFLLLVN